MRITTRGQPVFGGLAGRERRRGTALVEMALVLPVFITVILGIIEFGRALMVGQLVTNSAREGARLAIVDGSTNAQVIDTVQTFLQGAANVSPSDVTVTITVNGGGGDVSTAEPRDLISVAVSLPFTKVSYLPPTYLSNTNLKSSSSMRHE